MREKLNYSKRHPRPRDVMLVMEAADDSLAFDLGEKADLYAKAGIKEYWVFDVKHRRIEVFRSPRRGKYTSRERSVPGDEIHSLAFPDID